MKRKRCGTCDGCRQVQDCGMCVLCKDKPKFGGRGKRKQCCKLKVCNFIANKTVPPSESLEEAQHLEMSKKMKFDHTIDTYLQVSGHKLHSIAGDGNCIYRTISYAFLGTEDHHLIIRSSIVRLINLNRDKFLHYLIPSVNKPTIDEHIRHMMLRNNWPTQVEILAAATLYRLPIYFCTTSLATDSFKWGVIKPLLAEKIRFPHLVDEEYREANNTLNHIEMYHEGHHYDAIVSVDGNDCLEVPELTGVTHSDISID